MREVQRRKEERSGAGTGEENNWMTFQRNFQRNSWVMQQGLERAARHEMAAAAVQAPVAQTERQKWQKVQEEKQQEERMRAAWQALPERRQWQDGGWYTLQDFVNASGLDQGQYEWQMAPRQGI